MNKTKYKKILIVICIIAFIYFAGGIVYSCLKKSISTNNKSKVDNGIQIKGFEYILYDNQIKLYKDEFKILKENLESKKIDYKEYAKSISKMFIIDLYNLDSKKNMYDVGGVVFVYPDARENYKLNVTNTLYKYMKDTSNGDRKQKLPKVKSVEVTSIEDNKFKIGEEEFDGYKTNVNVEYVEDMGYDKKSEIVIIRKDKYLYIVEKNNLDTEENKEE